MRSNGVQATRHHARADDGLLSQVKIPKDHSTSHLNAGVQRAGLVAMLCWRSCCFASESRLSWPITFEWVLQVGSTGSAIAQISVIHTSLLGEAPFSINSFTFSS